VNVNIATLNMRGSTTRDMSLLQKWSYISQTMYRRKIVILALQESYLDQEKTKRI
jgi:hypothetical protein